MSAPSYRYGNQNQFYFFVALILLPAFCFTFPSDTVRISNDSHGLVKISRVCYASHNTQGSSEVLLGHSQSTKNGLIKISRVSCASHNSQESSEAVLGQSQTTKRASKSFARILCFAQHTCRRALKLRWANLKRQKRKSKNFRRKSRWKMYEYSTLVL